jgi:signal transduction histidine kinase
MRRQITANAEAMDRLLQAMYAEEERLLAERQQREQSSFTVTVGILATSLFLALVLFLIHHQLLTDQVRERVRAESSLRALSARLLTLQDEERRKFARELHDSVGQQLVAMKMGISALQQKLPDDQIVEDCLKILDESIAETRTISHLLHPPLLDEAGLKSALRWFVEGFGKRSGIEVTILTQDGPERFSEAVELALFRVLQESLTNVHRHSGATRADVSLSTEGNQVILRVKDHGCGIPDTVLAGLRDEGVGLGVGLAGMTQRIREIGGRLEINSGPSGTEITVAIPLEQKTQPRGTSSPAAQAVSG